MSQTEWPAHNGIRVSKAAAICTYFDRMLYPCIQVGMYKLQWHDHMLRHFDTGMAVHSRVQIEWMHKLLML